MDQRLVRVQELLDFKGPGSEEGAASESPMSSEEMASGIRLIIASLPDWVEENHKAPVVIGRWVAGKGGGRRRVWKGIGLFVLTNMFGVCLPAYLPSLLPVMCLPACLSICSFIAPHVGAGSLSLKDVASEVTSAKRASADREDASGDEEEEAEDPVLVDAEAALPLLLTLMNGVKVGGWGVVTVNSNGVGEGLGRGRTGGWRGRKKRKTCGRAWCGCLLYLLVTAAIYHQDCVAICGR
jgi:hypothetical protein